MRDGRPAPVELAHDLPSSEGLDVEGERAIGVSHDEQWYERGCWSHVVHATNFSETRCLRKLPSQLPPKDARGRVAVALADGNGHLAWAPAPCKPTGVRPALT